MALKKLIAAAQIAAMLTFGPVPGMMTPASEALQTSSVATADGLHTATFDLPAGKIKVYLPDDMAAGDTISGTVTVEPKGSTDSERESNTGVLNGTVLDIGGEKARPGESFMRKVRRPVGSSPAMFPVLLDPPGGNHPTFQVPVLSDPPARPSAVALPTLGQAGRPIQIAGPFDGIGSTTACAVGGQPIKVLAESPRKVISRSPTGTIGATNIAVTENGQTVEGPFRNLSVNLSAPKTNLTRGEQVKVHLEIKGIKGESSTVPVRMVTSGSANMQGGNTQTFEIKPGDVPTDGVFRRAFSLTGTSAGVFNVTATAVPPAGGQPVKQDKCKCECELAKNPIVTAGTRSIEGGKQHSFAPNIAKASCNGNRCSVSTIEYAWSIGGGSTATYTARGHKAKQLDVDVTKAGTLELTVTVTVTCSDGSTCSATGSKTFSVDTK